jgi:hypothetical protein
MTGLAPATGHPKVPAGSPEHHFAITTAVAAAVVLPGARTTTTMMRVTTTTFPSDLDAATRGICQRLRLIPHAILEGKRKERASPSRSCLYRRLTTNLGLRRLRTE